MAGVVNIGFGDMVTVEKIAAIVSPDSTSVRNIINQAKENGKLIDSTRGKKTRSVIILDSDHVILSSVLPITIGERAEKNSKDKG